MAKYLTHNYNSREFENHSNPSALFPYLVANYGLEAKIASQVFLTSKKMSLQK